MNIAIINVPTTEHAYMLMLLAECQLCAVQKYYWVSKFDPEYIEYLEPKVYDAFTCTVVLQGEEQNIKDCMDAYNNSTWRLDGIRNETYMTEEDIKKTADRFFSKFYIKI